MTSMQAMFDAARATAQARRAAAEISDRIRESERAQEARRVVGEAHALIENLVLAGCGTAVEMAASAGELEATILTFDGAATTDDVGLGRGEDLAEIDKNAPSLLFLIKGPREKYSKRLMRAAGVRPVLETLRPRVAPFQVRLDWDELTNVNRLVMYGW